MKLLGSLLLVSAIALGTTAAANGASTASTFAFNFRHSSSVESCLEGAGASAKLFLTDSNTEKLNVTISHAPPNTEFDVFIIQVPTAPFGLSWYQGDVTTDSDGHGFVTFLGRFSIETFAVAPGTATAPHPHETDATTNPAFNPIHTYHVGIWFGSPAESVAAGCANVTTPFNGDHNAGPQAFNTSNFPVASGPLRH